MLRKVHPTRRKIYRLMLPAQEILAIGDFWKDRKEYPMPTTTLQPESGDEAARNAREKEPSFSGEKC